MIRATVDRAAARLEFRPIVIPDDVALAAVHRRDSFVASFGHAEPFGDEAAYARYLGRLSERLRGSVVFAVADGEVVGQIESQVRPDGTGYVNLYYLVPKFRRRGLGLQLHEHVVAVLRGQGVTQIELAVSPTNGQALRFYERLGYHRLGLRADAQPPVLEMRLDLAAADP